MVRVAAGPARWSSKIRIPTLLIQGTADTLFTLDEAHHQLPDPARQQGALKMIWFCGGHGACLTDPAARPDGSSSRLSRWFERYLKRDKSGRDRPAASSGSPTTARCAALADYPPPCSG